MDVLKLPLIKNNRNFSRNQGISSKLKISQLYLTGSVSKNNNNNNLKNKSKQPSIRRRVDSNYKESIDRSISNHPHSNRIVSSDSKFKMNQVKDILLDSKGIQFIPNSPNKFFKYKVSMRNSITKPFKNESNQVKTGKNLNLNNSVKFDKFIKRYNIGNVFLNRLNV